jgi:hypothetical protein
LVWHRRNNGLAAQRWLREVVRAAAEKKADELGVDTSEPVAGSA